MPALVPHFMARSMFLSIARTPLELAKKSRDVDDNLAMTTTCLTFGADFTASSRLVLKDRTLKITDYRNIVWVSPSIFASKASDKPIRDIRKLKYLVLPR